MRAARFWFGAGALFLLVAVVVGGVFVVRLLSGYAPIEATVPADGVPHSVAVGTGGDQFVWVQEYHAGSCEVRDFATGDEVPIRAPGGTINRWSDTYRGGVWTVGGVVDAGSGRLSVTCSTAGGPIEIGPADGEVVQPVAGALLASGALSGAGLLMLRRASHLTRRRHPSTRLAMAGRAP